ncbi:hypothetical protein BGZ76_006094 [Entomortierella beljakovae]|nr:hypothetical protein BGZ76_006094 [Entomortierella beljakovae]
MVVISIPASVSHGSESTKTLAKCLDTDSIIMLEFQGQIEMDGTTWAGNALGQLSILDGGVKAQLVIGNHRLDGKVIALGRPLLLIQKQNSLDGISNQTQSQGESTKDKGKGKGKATSSAMEDDQSPFTTNAPASPSRMDDDDTMTSTNWGEVGAYATTGSNPNVMVDPYDPANIRQTVQYDTVAIIREKILFNTMPIPIIHAERRGLTAIKRGV